MTIRRLFVLLFVIALYAMAVRETLDPDMWWHLRTGEYILQRGIPRHDIFSFTVPNNEWITHEWLSEVMMWGVYRLGGLPLLLVAFAALTALTFWLVYSCCEGRPYLAAFVTLLAALASAIVWGARPQIFNLLLLALFVWLVERYRAQALTARWLWLLPLLTAVWANLHSGYLLGVVLLGTYTVGMALDGWRQADRWHRIRPLALVTAASFLAAALNPNGVKLWVYPFLTLGSRAMQTFIQEWQAPDFRQAVFWPFAALLVLGVGSVLLSGTRPSWTEALLFGGTAVAGLTSSRNIPIFAIVAAPIVARHLLLAAEGTAVYPLVSGTATLPAATRLQAGLNWLLLGLALLGAALWTVQTVSQNKAAIVQRYPVTAVDYLIEQGMAEAQGYNSYNWGGYLIWRGLPVFVDGRADVYGDTFLFEYRRAFDGTDRWRQPLESYDVDYILIERDSALVAKLAQAAEWAQVYTDDLATIFVRRGGS